MSDKITLSIVVPVFNEAENLELFYKKVKEEICKINSQIIAIDYGFVFVNDGSKDNSLEVLENLKYKDEKIKIVDFSRNFGKEAAILAGLQEAYKQRVDCVVLIDADMQDPIEFIYTMFEKYYKEGKEIVFARRIDREGEGVIKRFLSESFYRLSNCISEVKIHSGVRDFRLMSREVVEAILELKEYHRFSKAIFEWVGFNKEILEYKYIPRNSGVSGWSFWKLFKYAIEGLISFSTLPLRLAFVVGFLASFLAFLYGIWIIFDTLYYGSDVKGYPSLMCVIVFFGGLHLIVLGVIGEYIARIYEQVKGRPHFIVRKRKIK
ncbi:glycosyltransferase family 2 protein [Helicobacter burdigaliensis]|uniref:glycosyltransferase family 2 protein n=1 Tax=Helicobacter burdigaliensis TaxID=2315334 RepID=UPI000EF6FDB3|nr:glycosyltransferase family 2 protein [Helicobacter burdigaliensis]